MSLRALPQIAPRAAQPIMLCGVDVEALNCGALFWRARSTLVVSDLHLEKASSYAEGGQMLPPYDTEATLRRIEALIDALVPQRVVSLGDSFHDRRSRQRLPLANVATIHALTARTDWIWIVGNHDPLPPEDLGGRILHEHRDGPLVMRHEPQSTGAAGEIAGHLHPCARVAGRGRTVRARCFVSDGERLVMPAYGALTGGLNVLDPAFADLFGSGMRAHVLGRDGVYTVSTDRLAPDARRRRAAG
ncbi:MAG: ligase-associated DNA damage response endonuclease PdeM [Hyphomonadaceae bacterium]